MNVKYKENVPRKCDCKLSLEVHILVQGEKKVTNYTKLKSVNLSTLTLAIVALTKKHS